MSRDDALPVWLKEHAEEVFHGVPDGPHLSDTWLVNAPPIDGIEPEAQAHLLGCVECRAVWRAALEAAVESAPEPARPFRWHRWALRGAVAAGVGVLLTAHFSAEPPAPEFVSRGAAQTPREAPALSLRAVSAEGQVRDLPDRATVQLRERLGFVYGNADGVARTLTIIGYDGRQLHWYYPDAPGPSGLGIESGPNSRGTRLPYDVALAPDHRLGELVVVGAFDADSSRLAAQLQAGAALDASVMVFRLTVVP
jgi:hypothetical protein